MPKLRLYEFELTVLNVEDRVDKKGTRYLLTKGYHAHNEFNLKGKQYKAYDSFSAIALYGSNQLLDETIRRLNKVSTHKLVIDVLDADIMTTLKKKKILTYLFVYFYDFKKDRMGTRKLIKKLQNGEN